MYTKFIVNWDVEKKLGISASSYRSMQYLTLTNQIPETIIKC